MNQIDLNLEWQYLLTKVAKLVGKKPTVDSILFLIGVQELGKGKRTYSKEEKQDLMHIGICKILSKAGYYELEGQDKDGWPHWKSVKPLPNFKLDEQENLLKMYIIEYFSEI